jgi:hypothetical protein
MPNPYETWDHYPKREDPHPEEIAQRTVELGRGLEALVWFQDWVTDVLAGAGVAESGDDYKVTRKRPASKVQWVIQAWALEEELHELLRAVGWKPWKETPPPEHSEVMDENGDVLAFTGNILRYILALPGAKIRPHELADAYARVTQRNVARYRGQVPGYDVPGVKSAAVEDGAKSWLTDKTNGPLPGGEHLTRPTIGTYAVPEPGVYHHFKGGTYEVLGTVQHSETRELMVRYRAVGGTEAYEKVRPVSMWSDRVDRDGYSVPRFQRVVDDSGRPV